MASNENEDYGNDFVPTDDAPVVADKVDPAVEAEVVETKEFVEGIKPEEKVEEKVEDKDPKVPHSRMKEAVDKERERTAAAMSRAKELEAQLAAQVTSQDIVEAQKTVKDFIKQRNSFLGDGELDKASAIDEKIFELQEAIADRKAEIKAESSRAKAVETMKYDNIVERIERDHPELNPDADTYDDDVAVEMRALMRGYQSELGMTPAQALARAEKRMFPVTAKEVDPKKEDDAGLRRKKEATERNIDAAKKTPADPKDVGIDHDKKGGSLDAKAVMGMSYEQFSKVGDEALSKLRGDSL